MLSNEVIRDLTALKIMKLGQIPNVNRYKIVYIDEKTGTPVYVAEEQKPGTALSQYAKWDPIRNGKHAVALQRQMQLLGFYIEPKQLGPHLWQFSFHNRTWGTISSIDRSRGVAAALASLKVMSKLDSTVKRIFVSSTAEPKAITETETETEPKEGDRL